MTGQWLKDLRTEAGLSQGELAIKLGIHRNSIGLYESGADMPVSLFVRVCQELGKHPSYVIFKVLEAERSGL